MNKPDFRTVSKMQRDVLLADKGLKDIIDSQTMLEDESFLSLGVLKEDNARKTLNETPLSALNASRQGIRISALSQAGFNTVGELIPLTLAEIDSIKGIGTGSAELIYKTVRDIEKTVYDNSKARLSASSRTPGAVTLVTALYKVIHTDGIRKDAAKLYYERHRPAAEALNGSSLIKNTFFWIFSGKEKKQRTLDGVERLSVIFSGDLIPRADRLINDHLKVMQVSGEEAWNDFLLRPAYYFTALENITEKYAGESDIAEIHDRLRSDVPDELANEIDRYVLKLEGMKTALRSYQTFGTKYILYQEKTLLGDEMGLGKTVQAIAAMVSLSNEGKKRFIVICPASVLINWVREVRTFSGLTPLLIRDNEAAENVLTWRDSGGIAVVNYEALQKFRGLLPDDFHSDMTVVDEAHYIKNPEAKRTAAAKEIFTHSDKILLMTGTPLENHIEEMKNLIGLINTDIAKKISNTEDSWSGDGFRRKIAPVYLRRTREDVLSELPDLIENEEICPVGEAEKISYRADLDRSDFMGMRQVSFKGLNIEDSSKIKRIKEICENAATEGRKVLIFSYFKNTIEMIKDALGDSCVGLINGSLSSAGRQETIDKFTSAAPGSVLVSQIVAGGTGLNIQAASVVILAEPQIKPSLETQAVSRAYRMGQLSTVLLFRMISDDTIDEEILKILKTKQDIFDKFADGSDMADAGASHWISGAIEEQKKIFG